ncbi:MAG TPA: RagB/SusD family nutrient uptake outer membrane protein [Chitinophaga sp.]|uniref:RagB/SusD family nutrient uptake outer membrane protein n=1 Tax=Chitinophaga sp. TaxID=1869181 RepID=UPI002DBC1AA2|nr:RagB/SusD family nutrient uptake outer membrane protein [Chitinophaga sp.]HEU4551289.1 RagB/SusD family nutrient uptake outer membrane protein [Chitinophaga sp.]
MHIHHTLKILLWALLVLPAASCKKYLEIDPASNLVTTGDAYTSDASATSAVLSMYSYYPTTYCLQYFTYLGGLASDELQYTGSVAGLQEFAQSAVSATNSYNESYLWTYPYQVIREANLAINGITSSAALSAATRSQLLGEAKFFRAFIYFNLVNYMGGVPLSLDPVELNNAYLSRAAADTVYNQVIADLKDAQSLLPESYAGTASLKARVNKWAATALLARVYLYVKNYPGAEAEAAKVINAGVYALPELSSTFQNTSSETILQVASINGYSPVFGAYRTASSNDNVAPPVYTLSAGMAGAFEAGDNRRSAWVDSTTYNNVKYYRINKYKLSTATTGNEYTVLLRLAEQYLIRAEARAQQANIGGAQSDLDEVRRRAGLGNTTAATRESLLLAVAQERRAELFGEFSHRWFDLKRTGLADAVLGALKPTWKSTAVLMPVPYNQRLQNTNLTQNPGY